MKLIRLILILFIVYSCSSKKDIIIFQNSDKLQDFEISFEDNLIKSDDILNINVGSEFSELSSVFNIYPSSIGNSLDLLQIQGYLVDSNGYINFPVIGKLLVKGLSSIQVSELIFNKIVETGLLINPSVDVKIISQHFTVLGEVNIPGKYSYIQNNMDIFKALGMAGDLTINAKRNDIRILRNNEGKLNISKLDLTKVDFVNLKKFQIYSGDIIIVNPNKSRIKNAGIIGNSGTLLSLLSFLLSSIIVITNS